MQVYLNGEFLDQKKAAVSVADRGFVFGDGVYEVTRVVNGKFFQEKEHLDRLDEGLRGLKIKLRSEIRDSIPNISRELIQRNGHAEGEATVYLQVTRGAAFPRTHTFPEPEVPATVYLSSGPFKPHKELHEKGVDVITVPDVRWTRCNLKTVNLLPNTLARQQAKEAGVNSAVMIRDGVVTESPNANIFAVKDGTLYTFPASNYILNGITRKVIIDIAKSLDIPLVTEPVRQDDLYELDELFFTGTTTDVQPIVRVDGREIGNGTPGRIVKSIQQEYNSRLYG
ncbi:D-amino-acid transaminase [Rhodohalobacter halophilus]|uniref:D-amino-acid transaminase n=1 Tax=Rhodohalobacter halophilus TaxID=1812810 RepID=UPI00083F60C3|nr:D-amino-acid transaminase [Rhodohalobacter halophilus]